MRSQTYPHQKILNTKVKQYLICQQLGQGASAKVYLAIHQDTKQQFAIKAISKAYLNSDKKLMQLVKTQISILKSCNNQNIIKCYQVCQSKDSIFIVMQYCNGLDMQKYVKNKKYLSQDHAIWYLKQMLNGFKGLHQIGVMHRDFKLPNLLLHDRVCKIADLGFAKQMKDQDLTNTILGTEITMAPQVLERKPYGINADIWSLGVVFYRMLTGKYPYKGGNTQDLIKNIKNKKTDIQNLRISKMAKNFIQGCLTYDIHSRINWKQIYNHPLLNKSTIQLTYGISNATQIFFINQQFYRTQSFDDRQDSLIILRTSARKQIIIQEINQIKQTAIQCAAIYRNSLKITQHFKFLIKYGINYGVYLNQLIYPMKFIDQQQAQSISNIDHYTPIYLIYKKVFYQIRQFKYIIIKRINIFKIQILWQEFLKCSIYSDLINIVQTCFDRASALFLRSQRTLKNIQSPFVQYDQRIGKLINQNNVNKQLFSEVYQQYIYKYAKKLMKALIQQENKENIDLIQICQALLFYMDKAGKDKLTPQRFDWNRSRNINYFQQRKQLISKFQLLFSQ